MSYTSELDITVRVLIFFGGENEVACFISLEAFIVVFAIAYIHLLLFIIPNSGVMKKGEVGVIYYRLFNF